jgi:HK97 family phage major capsid protein
MSVVEMRERQARLVTEARSTFDQITNDTPAERAAELNTQYDRIMADHDRVGEQIARSERLSAAQTALDKVIGGRPGTEDRAAGGAGEGDRPTYDQVFAIAMRHGVEALDREQRNQLMAGRVKLEGRAQTSLTGSSGGFTVPVTLANEIDIALKSHGPMMDESLVRVITTTGGEQINYPTVDDTAIIGEKKAENAGATDDAGNDVVFGQKPLNAFMYDSEIVRVPIELLQDSAFNIEALMGELFGERLGRTVNEALTIGDGTGDPNGIVTASTAGKTAAAVAAITADEIIDLLHSVNPAYRASPSCAFMFNDATLAVIRKLKDGQGNYLWQMGDVRAGVPGTLLGQRYVINQAMESLAAAKKVMLFGDMKKYLVRRVGTYTTLRLNERFIENLQVGFLAYMRADGELINTGAVKHLITAAS